MLRSRHTLDIDRVVEASEVFIRLANAVVLRAVAILDVSHTPTFLAHNLKGTASLALLLSLKTHKVLLVWLRPRSRQLVSHRLEYARMTSLLLNEHVILSVTLQVVNVGIDGGIAPIEEDTRLGQLRERLVRITIHHAVILVPLVAAPDGIVNHVAALLTVGPHMVRVPENLRSPHTVNLRPVSHHVGTFWVAENLVSLAEVKRLRSPVDEVITRQEVDAIVEPRAALAVTHVRGHHQIALLPVRPAAHVCIPLSSFDEGMLFGVHDGLATIQVMIMQTVAAQGVCRKLALVAHVAVEIAIRTPLHVLRREVQRRQAQHQQARQENTFLHRSNRF